jgi:hypothetical protein
MAFRAKNSHVARLFWLILVSAKKRKALNSACECGVCTPDKRKHPKNASWATRRFHVSTNKNTVHKTLDSTKNNEPHALWKTMGLGFSRKLQRPKQANQICCCCINRELISKDQQYFLKYALVDEANNLIRYGIRLEGISRTALHWLRVSIKGWVAPYLVFMRATQNDDGEKERMGKYAWLRRW